VTVEGDELSLVVESPETFQPQKGREQGVPQMLEALLGQWTRIWLLHERSPEVVKQAEWFLHHIFLSWVAGGIVVGDRERAAAPGHY